MTPCTPCKPPPPFFLLPAVHARAHQLRHLRAPGVGFWRILRNSSSGTRMSLLIDHNAPEWTIGVPHVLPLQLVHVHVSSMAGLRCGTWPCQRPARGRVAARGFLGVSNAGSVQGKLQRMMVMMMVVVNDGWWMMNDE